MMTIIKKNIGQRTIDIKVKERERENARQNNGLNMKNNSYKANINSSQNDIIKRMRYLHALNIEKYKKKEFDIKKFLKEVNEFLGMSDDTTQSEIRELEEIKDVINPITGKLVVNKNSNDTNNTDGNTSGNNSNNDTKSSDNNNSNSNSNSNNKNNKDESKNKNSNDNDSDGYTSESKNSNFESKSDTSGVDSGNDSEKNDNYTTTSTTQSHSQSQSQLQSLRARKKKGKIIHKKEFKPRAKRENQFSHLIEKSNKHIDNLENEIAKREKAEQEKLQNEESIWMDSEPMIMLNKKSRSSPRSGLTSFIARNQMKNLQYQKNINNKNRKNAFDYDNNNSIVKNKKKNELSDKTMMTGQDHSVTGGGNGIKNKFASSVTHGTQQHHRDWSVLAKYLKDKSKLEIRRKQLHNQLERIVRIKAGLESGFSELKQIHDKYVKKQIKIAR